MNHSHQLHSYDMPAGGRPDHTPDAIQPPGRNPGSAAVDSSEAIYMIDGHGTILFATPIAASRYGYTIDEILGRRVVEFMPDEFSGEARRHWDELRAGTKRTSMEMLGEAVTKAGQVRRVRASIWRLADPDRFLVVHRFLDDLRDRLETLYSVLATMSGLLDLDSILEIVLTEAQRLIPADAAGIFMLDDDDRIKMAGARGMFVDNFTPEIISGAVEFATFQLLRESGQPLIINDCHNDPRWNIAQSSEHIRSWLGTPLIHHGEFLGVLNLDSTQPDTFTPEDAALAQALASQVAAALHNARRYTAERQRAERYAALNDINQAISRLDLPSVLEVIYRKLSALIDIPSFFIALYDAETEEIRVTGAYENGEHLPDDIQDASEGLSGLVIRTRKMIVIDDTRAQPPPDVTIVDGEVPLSLVMIPLVVQEAAVGVLSVQSYRANAFTADDIALLEAIAGGLAAAIRNAQLFTETRGQLAALTTLHRMSLELASVQDPQSVAQLTLRAVLDLYQPDQIELYVASEPPDLPVLWVAHAAEGTTAFQMYLNPPDDDLRQQVLAAGRPVVAHDLSAHPAPKVAFGADWHAQALTVYPMMRGDEVQGVLLLLYAAPHRFRRDELRTLDLLSMQAATALQNARYNATLRRRLHEVTILQDMARRVSSSMSLDNMLQMVVETMRETYHCISSSIGLYDPETEEVVIRHQSGLLPEILPEARFKLGEYVAGQVVATGEVIYVEDTAAHPDFRVVDPRIRSLLTVPLMVHDRVIGTLGIDSAKPNAFTRDHERVLVIAGAQLAAAIETMRLLEAARQQAAELAAANDELAALDEVRNELVQNLSHELRSPLALVAGYAGLMRDDQLGSITEAQAEALDVILDKSQAISRMVNDILTLEQIRPETLTVGTIDLNALCDVAAASAELVHQSRGLTFELALGPGPYLVQGDRDRLTQVLDNLLGNAAKFSPDESMITIRTADAPDWPGFVQVSVQDRGIGIPADKMVHLFERFFQADRSIKNQYGGAGLGLAIVRQIVEAHHGTIWVESVEGEGSTFTFVLPLGEG